MSRTTDADLERQPLREEIVRYNALEAQPQVPDKRGCSRKKGFVLMAILAGCILYLLTYIWNNSPSSDAIEHYFEDATNVEVRGISFDGWYSDGGDRLDDPGDGGESDSPDEIKILKMRLRVGVWMDYESTSSSELSQKQARLLSAIGQSVMKTVCFNLKNMTTYNDNSTSSELLGFASVPSRICVDLRDKVVTELDIPVLVQPKIKNLASVILKIWKKKYKEIRIWSDLDVDLSKPLWKKWKLPIGNIKLRRFEWDDLINWEKSYDRLRRSFIRITEPFQVESFEFRDSTDGFDLKVDISCSIAERDDTIELPANCVLPPTVWKINLPDCNAEYSISLEHASFQTSAINMNDFPNEGVFFTSIHGQVRSSLPDQLLYQVCSSDEENVITPINLLLGKIFNGTELVSFEVQAQNAQYINNTVFPIDLINDFLPMVQFPVDANLTVNSDELIEQVSVDGLKLKWEKGKRGEKELAVLGKVIGIVNIPYYTSSGSGAESISIKKIKGYTNLYHEDRHFLTVPINVWKDAKSDMLPSDDRSKNQLQVSFDIANEEVEIVNRLQLTKCLNEILIRGQAQVFVEGTLDLMTETKLGDIVFFGLKGDGKTVVKK